MLLVAVAIAFDFDSRELHLAPLSWAEAAQLLEGGADVLAACGDYLGSVLPPEVLAAIPDVGALAESVGLA